MIIRLLPPSIPPSYLSPIAPNDNNSKLLAPERLEYLPVAPGTGIPSRAWKGRGGGFPGHFSPAPSLDGLI